MVAGKRAAEPTEPSATSEVALCGNRGVEEVLAKPFCSQTGNLQEGQSCGEQQSKDNCYTSSLSKDRYYSVDKEPLGTR